MFYTILRMNRDYFPNSIKELLFTTEILRLDPNFKYYLDEFHNSFRCWTFRHHPFVNENICYSYEGTDRKIYVQHCARLKIKQLHTPKDCLQFSRYLSALLVARSQQVSEKSWDWSNQSRFFAIFLSPRENADLENKFHDALQFIMQTH